MQPNDDPTQSNATPPPNQPTDFTPDSPLENPSSFKSKAKKAYIVFVCLLLILAGADGIYADATNHSLNDFTTPFDTLLILLGAGLFSTYIIKKRTPLEANQSRPQRITIIGGNVVMVIIALLLIIGAITSSNSNNKVNKPSSGKAFTSNYIH